MAKETVIGPAREVQRLAEKLIQEYRRELFEACILYFETSAAASCVPQRCNAKWRHAYSLHVPRIVTAEVASGPDFIVWVNVDEWEVIEKDGLQRPWVLHRLAHMGREETNDGPAWVILKHDFEASNLELQHFGAWHEAAKQAKTLLQGELVFSDGGAQ